MFDGVDKLQHLCWRFIDPELRPADPTPWEQEVIDLCDEYFAQLDGIIREIVEMAGADATVVIASDHGFGPSRDVFFVNTWLEQLGYLAWSSENEVPEETQPRLGISQISRHVYQLDWERTVAYGATPSSSGINIVLPKTGDGQVQQAYSRIRDEIVAALKDLRNPVTGEPVIKSVYTQDEVFAGPFEALGPDITFEMHQGAASILRGDEPIKVRDEVAGVHRPEGILLASGHGVRAGVSIEERSIPDVGPLLLALLGASIPDDVSGRMPLEIFDETHRGQFESSLRFHPATPPPELAGAPTEFDEEAEATMAKRLRALGYIE
jgi:predicted AlkP superfamily phosphohydrolase/phosphomutase